MRRLIFLYQNYQINKLSIIFMSISCLLLYFVSYQIIDFDVDNYLYLVEYNNLIKSYFFEIYTIIELMTVFFVIVLSFMELFNNGYLYDILFINPFGKDTVITCKIVSYCFIIITYLTLLFLGIGAITIYKFSDSYLIKDIFVLYLFTLNEAIVILLLSLMLIKLFNNYFANFILLIIFIVKRVLYESIDVDDIPMLLYLELDSSIKCDFNVLPTFIVPFILVMANVIIYTKVSTKY